MTENQCSRRFQPRQSLPPPPPDPRGRVEDGRDGRRARREEEEERARREKEEVLRNEEQPVDEEEEEEEEEEGRYTTVPSRGREEVGGYSVIPSMRRGREREEEQDQRRQKEEEEEQEEVEEETYSSSVPTLRRGQMRYHRLHQFSRLPPVRTSPQAADSLLTMATTSSVVHRPQIFDLRNHLNFELSCEVDLFHSQLSPALLVGTPQETPSLEGNSLQTSAIQLSDAFVS